MILFRIFLTSESEVQERIIRAEIDDVFLGPCLAPVDVDGVAHGLEGIEADADRQRQIWLGKRCAKPAKKSSPNLKKL